jgi:hypothetical protein
MLGLLQKNQKEARPEAPASGMIKEQVGEKECTVNTHRMSVETKT